jgi:hypothetical protein
MTVGRLDVGDVDDSNKDVDRRRIAWNDDDVDDFDDRDTVGTALFRRMLTTEPLEEFGLSSIIVIIIIDLDQSYSEYITTTKEVFSLR